MYAKVNILGDFQVHKLIYRFFTGALFVLVNILFFSRIAFSDEQVSSGWLFDYQHPSVSVQMQLTGEKDPLLKTVNAVLQVQLQQDWKNINLIRVNLTLSDKDSEKCQNVIKEHIIPLRKLFQRYSTRKNNAIGYMNILQFLYICNLCKLPDKK